MFKKCMLIVWEGNVRPIRKGWIYDEQREPLRGQLHSWLEWAMSTGERRLLSREQVMAWRENWSESDRRMIADHLDGQGAVSFYEPPSKQYVGCRGADGRGVLYISPGYLEFPKQALPEGLTEHNRWFGLSTFQSRDGSDPRGLEVTEVFPHCWMVYPLTGVCDCQD